MVYTPGMENTNERGWRMTCWSNLELESMLEDVMRELDLSDPEIARLTNLGAPPAEIVRKALQQKDARICYLLNQSPRNRYTDAQGNPFLSRELDFLNKLPVSLYQMIGMLTGSADGLMPRHYRLEYAQEVVNGLSLLKAKADEIVSEYEPPVCRERI
jgi:phosphoenolpyruvate carboxylase